MSNSIGVDFRNAKYNVKHALKCGPVEAECWMIANIGIIISGHGIYKRVTAPNAKVRDKLALLATPHGYALTKAVEARNLP